MEISYRRNANGNYMVVDAQNGYEHGNFELQMLLKNDIDSLVPLKIESLDGENRLLYDISQKHALGKLMTEKMTPNSLKLLIRAFGNCMNQLKEYLLNPEKIMFGLQSVYTNLEMDRFWFCYHPFYEGNVLDDLRFFFDQLLSKGTFEDSKCIQMVHKLRGLVLQDDFYLGELNDAVEWFEEREPFVVKKLFDDKKEDVFENPEQKSIYQMISEYEAAEQAEIESYRKEERKEQEAVKQEKKISFFEQLKIYAKGKKLKEIVNDIDDGALISNIRASRQYAPEPVMEFQERNMLQEYSERAKKSSEEEEEEFFAGITFVDMPVNGTKSLDKKKELSGKLVGLGKLEGKLVELKKSPFTIGKLREGSELVLNTNAVSRLHARIFLENGAEGKKNFLEDMNSTNGTYLNGTRLVAYTRTQLKSGDVISFAGEDFCFWE